MAWIRVLEKCGASGQTLMPGTIREVSDNDARVLKSHGLVEDANAPVVEEPEVETKQKQKAEKPKGFGSGVRSGR
jgi:hypothetical protein